MHLILLVNGLFGSTTHWSYYKNQLRQGLNQHDVFIHASEVNTRFRTYQGIDVCGERLKCELEGLVAENPKLQTLTIIGHSMGGLIARYAVGQLYDCTSRTICGLTALHFIAVASPHTGITITDGVSQMPLIQWLPWAKGLLQAVGPYVASSIFRRTGQQFLSLEAGEASVLLQLVHDTPDKGSHCFSALAAFKEWTAYSCVSGDHWVTWPNASLRLPHQLPTLSSDALHSGQGVLCEEPPTCYTQPHPQPGHLQHRQQHWEPGHGPETPKSTSAGADSLHEQRPVQGQLPQDTHQPQLPSAGGVPTAGQHQDPTIYMLQRLQSLAWRRVDVGFGGDPHFSGIPHNKVQARGWHVTASSQAVVQHMVTLLQRTLQGGAGL